MTTLLTAEMVAGVLTDSLPRDAIELHGEQVLVGIPVQYHGQAIVDGEAHAEETGSTGFRVTVPVRVHLQVPLAFPIPFAPPFHVPFVPPLAEYQTRARVRGRLRLIPGETAGLPVCAERVNPEDIELSEQHLAGIAGTFAWFVPHIVGFLDLRVCEEIAAKFNEMIRVKLKPCA